MRNIKNIRWVIVNERTGIMYTGVNETFRRTAINRYLTMWAGVGENLNWDDCRKKGDRAVKATIEVLE